jgi:hypothetical protein
MMASWWTVVLAIVLAIWRLVVLPLLQNEVVGWCEWLARWLVRQAVGRLPDTEQARWEEEWRSDLENLPTTLARLGWALGLRLHASEQAELLPDDAAQEPSAVARVPRPWLIQGAVFAVLAVLSILTWIGLGVGGLRIIELISNLTQASAALLAAAACLHTAHRHLSGVDRAWIAARHRAWRLLGWAALAWGLGQATWTVLELRAAEPRVPSLADAGYLAALPLLIAGVLAFPTAPMPATARLRTLLDGLLIAASLLLLGWATVLGDAFRANASTTTLERILYLAYPLGDIVAGTIAVLLLLRSRGRGNGHLAIIAAAVFSLLVADLGFAYKYLTGSYGTGAMIDAGWVMGWLLLLVTALKPAAVAPQHSKSKSWL